MRIGVRDFILDNKFYSLHRHRRGDKLRTLNHLSRSRWTAISDRSEQGGRGGRGEVLRLLEKGLGRTLA
jgi:hypothetical protein